METIWYGYLIGVGITAWLGSIILSLLVFAIIMRVIVGIVDIVASAIRRARK